MSMTPPLDDDELGDDQNYKKILMQQLQAQMQPAPPDPNNNALISSLNQSFSKFGTLGGRSSDTSDVTRYADILDKSKAARQNQDMAKTGMQSQILQKLAMLKDKNDQNQRTASMRQDQMDAAKLAKQEDRDFDLKKIGLENQGRINLEKLKRDNDIIANNGKNPAGKPTEAQSNSSTFAVRAKDAGTLADKIEKEGYDPATYAAAARKTKFPIVGQYFSQDDDRSYDQAKTDFITAVLRKESGATISDPEFAREEAKYFPAPGDSAQLKAQKAAARKRAVDTLIAAGGAAYDPKLQQPFDYKKEEQTQPGTAMANTPKADRPLEEMSDAELDAELARLKGK